MQSENHNLQRIIYIKDLLHFFQAIVEEPTVVRRGNGQPGHLLFQTVSAKLKHDTMTRYRNILMSKKKITAVESNRVVQGEPHNLEHSVSYNKTLHF